MFHELEHTDQQAERDLVIIVGKEERRRALIFQACPDGLLEVLELLVPIWEVDDRLLEQSHLAHRVLEQSPFFNRFLLSLFLTQILTRVVGVELLKDQLLFVLPQEEHPLEIGRVHCHLLEADEYWRKYSAEVDFEVVPAAIQGAIGPLLHDVVDTFHESI